MLKVFAVGLRSLGGVDVCDDGLHRFGEGGVLFHLFLHLLDGVEDGGVVPVVELLADLFERQVGHAADLIHGDLAGQGDVLGLALAPEGC